MKHTAYILYNADDDRHYETHDISKQDGEFKHKDIPYTIREHARYLNKKGDFKFKHGIIPAFRSKYERRSYYEAGSPEPLTWERPIPAEIEGKPVAFSSEDLYNAAVEQTSWKNLFKIGGGGGGYLGYIAIIALIIGGIAFIMFVLPMITGANIIPGA